MWPAELRRWQITPPGSKTLSYKIIPNNSSVINKKYSVNSQNGYIKSPYKKLFAFRYLKKAAGAPDVTPIRKGKERSLYRTPILNESPHFEKYA